MPRNILILGADGLLGSYLASIYLAQPDDVIHCLTTGTLSEEELSSSISQLVERNTSLQQSDTASAPVNPRLILHRLCCDLDDLGLADSLRHLALVSEAWVLPAGCYSDRTSPNFDQTNLLRKLLAALSGVDVKSLNLVTDFHADTASLKSQCAAQEINYRIFHTSLVVGESFASAHTCRDGFLEFLGSLHEIKSELEERIPDYFEFHALRCNLGNSEDKLNLVAADDAARQMFQLAQRDDTLSGEHKIAAPEGVSISELCDTIGMAYDLSLLPVDDHESLNAIDRDFDERIAGFRSRCAASLNPQSADAPVELRFDEQKQLAVFKAVRASQDQARSEWSQHCANLLSLLQRKTISIHGFDFTYYTNTSDGIPVVCLNALGQGLQYWCRLLGDLMRYHKVVIWEPRGTLSPPQPFGLKEQVDDLEAVLAQEGISACHLVGWCTGPKVAVDFYLRHPESVLTLAFLNSSFKCFGSPEDLDTEYEHNFEPLCRVLKNHPAMAPSVMKSLQGGEEEEIDLLDDSDNEELSRRVLALMNRDLKPHVRAPFQTVEQVLNYAHQAMDFWSCDTTKKAGEVKVPVMLVSSEYDQVASPATSQMAARLFPQSCLVHVRGATHYCLYDRPHFMAGLLEKFFRDPAGMSAHYAGCEEVACTS